MRRCYDPSYLLLRLSSLLTVHAGFHSLSLLPMVQATSLPSPLFSSLCSCSIPNVFDGMRIISLSLMQTPSCLRRFLLQSSPSRRHVRHEMLCRVMESHL